MTSAQAAARLGLSPVTVRQQCRKGIIQARKIARDWSIPTREIARYKREHLHHAGRKIPHVI